MLDNSGDAGVPIGQGEPEMTFFQLGSRNGSFNQEAGGKTAFQQAADRGIQFTDRIGRNPISAQGGGRRDPSKGRPGR